MAPHTSPLAAFEIPKSWADQCHDRISAILLMDRTLLAFAQIFDGIQTHHATAEMGDIDSIDLCLPQDVTEDAKRDAKSWLMLVAEDINNIMINAALAEEALSVLRSTSSDAHKIGSTLLCFIKPAIRSCLKEYLARCEASGRHLHYASFQQLGRGLPQIEAVQDWAEEYIFGGVLLHHNPKDKVYVRPFILAPFTFSYVALWQTDCLPLRRAKPDRRKPHVPALEDDPRLLSVVREWEKKSRDKY